MRTSFSKQGMYMAIDKCPHTFEELAGMRLPAQMKELRRAMRSPHPMAEFGQTAVGPKTLLHRMGRSKDFAGSYVLMRGSRPVYVGISRVVIHRIMQHVKGRTHYDASLAYRMACEGNAHTLTRDQAMKRPSFRKAFEAAKHRLRRMKVAFVEIEDPVELHLFEVYCAIKLDTARWNTFRTH